MKELFFYFIIGGTIVSSTIYFGSKGHGFLAAFISMFPSITVLTFVLLHTAGGKEAVISYAKSMLFLILPWIIYVTVVACLCERIGIWKTLLLGITLYMATSYIMLFIKNLIP